MGFDLEQPGGQPDSTLADGSGGQQPQEVIVDQDLDLGDAGLGDQQLAAEEEFEDIELDDGVKKVPKSLRDYVMRSKDYTLKTQEIAEQRRQMATVAEEVVRRQQFQQAHHADLVKLGVIDARLEQFQKVDWAALSQADHQRAQELRWEFDSLKDARTQQAQKISQAQQRLELAAQQDTTRRRQQLQQELVRDIPTLSQPEVQKGVYATLRAAGYEDQHINGVDFAPFIKLAHKAYLYDKLSKERTAKPAAEPAKPTTTVGGPSRAATGYTPTMTDAEFAKMRRAQIARRNRR